MPNVSESTGNNMTAPAVIGIAVIASILGFVSLLSCNVGIYLGARFF